MEESEYSVWAVSEPKPHQLPWVSSSYTIRNPRSIRGESRRSLLASYTMILKFYKSSYNVDSYARWRRVKSIFDMVYKLWMDVLDFQNVSDQIMPLHVSDRTVQ